MVAKLYWTLHPHDALSDLAEKRPRDVVEMTGVLLSNRGHGDQVSLDQFYSGVFVENPDFAQTVIFRDG